MSLIRLAVVLLAAIVLMLSVVVVRTETTRVERRTSEVDRDIALLRRLIREKELDLARLTSPAVIREMWIDVSIGEFPGKKPNSAPEKSPTTKRAPNKRP